MLRRLAFVLPALFGALLATLPVASRAASSSRQFMVFVQVLPVCRLAAPSGNIAGRATLAISCTRATGYSVSLTRGLSSRGRAYTVNGVGSGTRQEIPLRLTPAAFGGPRPQKAAPLFLTISY